MSPWKHFPYQSAHTTYFLKRDSSFSSSLLHLLAGNFQAYQVKTGIDCKKLVFGLCLRVRFFISPSYCLVPPLRLSTGSCVFQTAFHIIMEILDISKNISCDSQSDCDEFPSSTILNARMANVGNLEMFSTEYKVIKQLAFITKTYPWGKELDSFITGERKETMHCTQLKCVKFCNISCMFRMSSSVSGMSTREIRQASGPMLDSDKCFYFHGKTVWA